MILQTWQKRLVALVLAAATVLVLVTNVPTLNAIRTYWLYFLLFMALTALAVVLGVLLRRAEVSYAHAIGVMAFLALSEQAVPVTLWAVFVGGVLGGTVLMLRGQHVLRYRIVRRTLRNLMVTAARVTLSFLGAAELYLLTNGDLPLRTGSNLVLAQLIPYVALYIALYAVLYVLEWFIEGRQVGRILQDNGLQIFIALTVPVAYAIPVAVIHNELPLEMFALALLGFVVGTIVTFSYSRDQHLLRQQLGEMHALSTLSQELQADTDTPTLIRSMQRHLAQILEADDVLIASVRPGTMDMQYNQLHNGVDVGTVQPGAANTYLVKRLVDSRQPLLIEQQVPVYLQNRGVDLHEEDVHSWMGVPMTVRGRVLGATVVYSSGERSFRTSDLRLLQIIAATFATALDNAQLYQHQQERVTRLNTLNTISVLLSSTLSLENVLDTITTSAAMLSEAKAVAVYTRDEQANTDAQAGLQLQRSAGLSDKFLAVGVEPMLGQQGLPLPLTADDTMLVEMPPLVVPDVRQDGRVPGAGKQWTDEEIYAFIELPLASGQRLHGVVILYFGTVQHPSDEFIEFLRTFASEAVQAIKNAKLYTQTDAALETRLVQLSMLAAVGQQTNAASNVRVISDVILTFAIDYTEADGGAVIMREQESDTFYVASRRNLPTHDDADAALLALGRDRHANRPQEPLQPTHTDGRARLTVPIARDREPLGTLLLEKQLPNTFSKDEVNFISQLLSHASIAIDNRLLLQEVVQSNDRMQVILDAMSEAIVLINERGEIVMANPAVKLLGLAPEKILGSTLGAMVSAGEDSSAAKLGVETAHDAEQLLASFQGSVDDDPPAKEYVIQRAHNTLAIERQAIPIRDDNNRVIGLLLVFYDHTKQMQLDNTRDEFTRMIVHDLRSPLTAVTTSLYLIRQLMPAALAERDKIEGITRTSEQAIRKMMRRVDSILDIAKMESGEISLDYDEVQLAEVVQNVFVELAPLAAERKVTLSHHVPSDLPTLYADADKLERVIQNLVDNALKHTAFNTPVIVRAALHGVNGKSRHLVQIDVIDSGPGIPAADRDRLFDRFVQLKTENGSSKKPRRGVGLGLTFCRLVVEAHGGRIWVEDNPDGGSVFVFTLPTAAK